MVISIGADHRGFALKEKLKQWLLSEGHDVTDVTAHAPDPGDDYPDIAFAVSDFVIQTPGSVGIILCGSGGGVVIAANKVKGIRAAVAMQPEDVFHNRDHNDINVLAIASDFTSLEDAKHSVDVFLKTPFDTTAPRFRRRLTKILAREC
jgi:ribose 5-phosphate isomerase B